MHFTYCYEKLKSFITVLRLLKPRFFSYLTTVRSIFCVAVVPHYPHEIFISLWNAAFKKRLYRKEKRKTLWTQEFVYLLENDFHCFKLSPFFLSLRVIDSFLCILAYPLIAPHLSQKNICINLYRNPNCFDTLM